MTRRKIDRIEYLIQLAGNSQICANCKYFTEHYIKMPSVYISGGYQYQTIDSGHCCYPRLKDKNAWETCEHWQKNEGKKN